MIALTSAWTAGVWTHAACAAPIPGRKSVNHLHRVSSTTGASLGYTGRCEAPARSGDEFAARGSRGTRRDGAGVLESEVAPVSVSGHLEDAPTWPVSRSVSGA